MKKMIQEFSDAFGVSGHEDEVLEVARTYLNDFHLREDKMRNLFINETSNIDVLLDAHSDEVGFIIQAILDNGMMRFLPVGGWDVKNVVGSKVTILNRNNEKVEGIVASKPVHFMSEEQRKQPLSFDALVIDVGACSYDEVVNDFHIGIGCFVVPSTKCEYNEISKVFSGKAFDCRIGVAALVEVMKRLKNPTLNVSGILSSQEEVGERGMICAMNQIKPKVMIAFEGCPADDTYESGRMIQSGLKRGVMIRHYDRSMITSPRFMKFTIDVAKKHNIKIQESVRSGGGTNGGVVHNAASGIPCVILGIPVRYAHSCVGFCSLEDFESAVSLALAMIQELNYDIIDQF